MYCSARNVLSRFHRQYSLTPNILSFIRSAHNVADSENYDIVIVGGGMVGATMACTIG